MDMETKAILADLKTMRESRDRAQAEYQKAQSALEQKMLEAILALAQPEKKAVVTKTDKVIAVARDDKRFQEPAPAVEVNHSGVPEKVIAAVSSQKILGQWKESKGRLVLGQHQIYSGGLYRVNADRSHTRLISLPRGDKGIMLGVAEKFLAEHAA